MNTIKVDELRADLALFKHILSDTQDALNAYKDQSRADNERVLDQVARIEALDKALRIATMDGTGYRTRNGIRMEMPRRVAKIVTAALTKAGG